MRYIKLVKYIHLFLLSSLMMLSGCNPLGEQTTFQEGHLNVGGTTVISLSVTGLSSGSSASSAFTSFTWTWGCSRSNCSYRYIIDQNSTTTPTGSFGNDTSGTQSTGTGTYYIHVQVKDDSTGEISDVEHHSVVIDNTAPSNFDVNDWSMTNVTNGSTSNITSPEFLGTNLSSENGSEGLIFSDSSCTNQIGSGVISSGQFTVTNISLSGDGAKSFYGKIQDAAGNQNSLCQDLSLGYTLDTTPPSDLVPGNWSMSSPTSGSNSNDNTPVLSGTGISDAVSVNIHTTASCSSSAVGSGTVSSGNVTVNNISFATDGSDDGIYNFYGVAIDDAGNESANCTSLSLGYTLSVPAMTLTTPVDNDYINSLNIGSLTVSGTCSELGVSNSVVFVFEDSRTIPGPRTLTERIDCAANGTFSDTIDLSAESFNEGAVTLEAYSDSGGGNQSSSINLNLVKDTTLPSVTGLANDATVTNSKAWSWDCDDSPCTYQFSIDQTSNSTPSGSFVSSTSTTHATGDGTYYLHINAKDAAGNISSTAHYSFIMDTTAPSTPSSISWTVSVDDSEDSTPVIDNTGGATPKISGEDGSTINFYRAADASSSGSACSSSSLGSDTISSSEFTANLTLLTDGSHHGANHFYGQITDSAGNASSCFYTSLTHTLTGVQLSIDSLSASDFVNLNNEGSLVVSGSCAGDTGNVSLNINDVGNILTPPITDTVACNSGSGTYAFTGKDVSSFDDGDHVITVSFSTASDVVLTLTKDTQRPTLTGLANDSTLTNSKAWSWGCSESNCEYRFVIDQVSNTTDLSSSSYASTSTTTHSTGDGTFYLHIRGRDEAGNETTAVEHFSFLMDTTVPADPSGWAMSSPSNASTSSDGTPQFNGNATTSATPEENATAQIFALSDTSCSSVLGSATTDAAGDFTITNVSFATDGSADGTKSFRGKLVDSVGNASNCVDISLSYTLDTIIPTISVSSPSNNGYINSTNVEVFSITGSCSESTRDVVIGITDSGAGSVSQTLTCTGGSFSHTFDDANSAPSDISDLAEGAITLTVDHSDAAGNNATQLTLNLTKDTVAPTPASWTLDSPTNGSTSSNGTPQISGDYANSESGTIAYVYNDSGCATSVGNDTLDASGDFTIININYTGEGQVEVLKEFYGKMTDAAGNTSSCVDMSLSYTYDTVAPTLSITSHAITDYINSSEAGSVTVEGACDGSSENVAIEITDSTNTETGSGACNDTLDTYSVGTIDITSLNDGNITINADLDDAGGNSATQASVILVKDVLAPSVPSNVSFSNVTTNGASSPLISWDASSDATSGVAGYQVAIGTTQGASDVTSGYEDSSGVSTTISSLTLSAGTSYFVSVRSLDSAGNISADQAPASTFCYDGAAPASPTNLNDPADIFDVSASPQLTWDASTDDCSIDHYEIAIIRDSDDVVMVSYTDVGDVANYTFSGISPLLSAGVDYVFSIKAVDIAGRESSAVESNPWQVIAPNITGFDPIGSLTTSAGNIVIDGTNFSTSATVTIDGETCVISAQSSTQITCAIPDATVAGTVAQVDLVVSNSTGNTDTDNYYYLGEPSGAEDLRIWLDADDASTITEVGGLFPSITWDDISGNNQDFDQDSFASVGLPAYQSTGFSGMGQVYFDGGDELPSSANVNITSDDLTIVTALNPNGNANATLFSAGTMSLSCTSGGELSFSYDGTALSSSGFDLSSATTVVSIRRNSSGMSLYGRGVLLNSNTTPGSPTDLSSVSLTLGADWDGGIGEILIYGSALSDTEREALENYMGDKWGVSVTH